MTVFFTALSALAIKEEARKLGLEWRDIQGLEVVHFEDGSKIILMGEGGEARTFVDHLVALGIAEPT